MQILLDGVKCDIEADSVSEAVLQASASAEEAGRRIIEVHVDGELLADDDPKSRWEGDAGEVRLVSASAGGVARESLHQAADALAEIDQLQQQAAELVQTDQMVEAMALLNSAICQWQLVHDITVKSAAFASIDLNEVLVEGRPFATDITELATRLRSLTQALASGDGVALADTLLYEMPEVISRWQRSIRAAAESIDMTAGTPQ